MQPMVLRLAILSGTQWAEHSEMRLAAHSVLPSEILLVLQMDLQSGFLLVIPSVLQMARQLVKHWDLRSALPMDEHLVTSSDRSWATLSVTPWVAMKATMS